MIAHTSTVGINQFADVTAAEFKQSLGAIKGTQDNSSEVNTVYLDEENLAASVDWRAKGAVTGVKNQGQCGSCWAFSTIGSLEGHHQIASGKLVSLSEQQLVDCSTVNQGCNGGWMDKALSYTIKNPVESEKDYPYVAVGQKCKYVKSKGIVSAKTVYNVAKNNNAQLKAAVAKGPVTVAIEADQTVYQSYTGGIISSSSCGTSTDHGVLVVGYGEGYWIVKNSWGPSWGEKGFVRIADKAGAGVCGINTDPAWATTN